MSETEGTTPAPEGATPAAEVLAALREYHAATLAAMGRLDERLSRLEGAQR